ncbi:hypothetical protein I350_03945 [Cryptococcus amylolentus CBS 6273]|uniref:Uncharacterized protein n=1 Tax=Cryptococcus amylolentus CBS 6273 TaxID=1296118 RepID=A0A1E3K0K3_9TREE|nr:hypothetical protein I350_03945 [Cryptococcus amylolentus CBS 6273]
MGFVFSALVNNRRARLKGVYLDNKDECGDDSSAAFKICLDIAAMAGLEMEDSNISTASAPI